MRATPSATLHGPDAPRASFIVPRAAAVFIASVSLTLLAVGAMSPYTHSNLVSGYDRAYTRTDQIVVGTGSEFMGLGQDRAQGMTDPVARGASLYVTEGCVSCHALEGRGGPVGPAIAGTDKDTITQRVRQGPGGMPHFSESALTADEISDIAAYLRSVATGQ